MKLGALQNLVARFAALVGVRRMADVSQLTPQIWTGGAITSKADVEYIVALGITADADMRLEYNDRSALEEHPRIAYLYNGVADDGKPKPISWFKTTWDWAQPILSAGGVVLCHCASGVNRGPSMAYFLLRASGMPEDKAFALIQKKRPIAGIAYRRDADVAIAALKLGLKEK